jgi:uncharacterized DUF497 family protein
VYNLGTLFQWDERKNIINIAKHGVSFDEAKTVFSDDYAVFQYDEEHSENEERFIVIGNSMLSRTLLVCHCYKEEDIVRIFSARVANNSEAYVYFMNKRWN